MPHAVVRLRLVPGGDEDGEAVAEEAAQRLGVAVDAHLGVEALRLRVRGHLFRANVFVVFEGT